MVAVLALALLGLKSGGPSGAGTTAGGSGASSPTGATAALSVPGQSSQGGYSSAIQAAQNAVSEAGRDAQSAANAGP
jgi:hypothetical protein